MNDIHEKCLNLNAVTGEHVNAPAVSPDTLRELAHPYFGFLQTYSLFGKANNWHGQLKNIGMQYSIPFSILLPPHITEMLQLNNDDTIILKPSLISEARIIYFKRIAGDKNQLNSLPELILGMEIDNITECKYDGIPIEIVEWAPEGCFYGPGTDLVETEGIARYDFTPENQSSKVYTDIEDNNNLNKEPNDFNSIN